MLAVLCAGAAIDLYAHAGQPARRAWRCSSEVVAELTELWQVEWFLGQIRLSALAIAGLADEAARVPQARRAQLRAAGRRADRGGPHAARPTACPPGARLGVEGVAWLARAEAEWARMRWLAGGAVTHRRRRPERPAT